ncbi:MAG: YceD family protein, partial [Xanthomonadales bacterium]|nr:YceD family protein [Xanthomonadales bacterium]
LLIYVVRLPVKLIRYQLFTGLLYFWVSGFHCAGKVRTMGGIGLVKDCEAMSREYPDWISPNRAAEGKRIFSGTIPLARMKRLAELLVNAQGEASFSAAFRMDLEKRIVIDLQVEAALPLICQASLEVYDEQVSRRSELAVIEEDGEQFELPEDYEPVQTENGRLAFVSLVEDELLLALPQIPRKPGLKEVDYSTGGQTGKEESLSEGSRKNPFSALQDMLKQDKSD